MSLFDQLNKQTATVEIQQLLGLCFGYTIGRSSYTEVELEALHNTLTGCSMEGSLMGSTRQNRLDKLKVILQA